eukprot:1182480-Prorocentrum_minimum.AAC.2
MDLLVSLWIVPACLAGTVDFFYVTRRAVGRRELQLAELGCGKILLNLIVECSLLIFPGEDGLQALLPPYSVKRLPHRHGPDRFRYSDTL